MKKTLRRASLHICGIYIRIEFHKQTAHVYSVIPSRNMQRTHRTAEHKMITTPRTTMEICTMKHTKIKMLKQMMVRREKMHNWTDAHVLKLSQLIENKISEFHVVCSFKFCNRFCKRTQSGSLTEQD